MNEETVPIIRNDKNDSEITRVRELYTYIDQDANDDWICGHDEFPFCDCLANYAKQDASTQSKSSQVYGETTFPYDETSRKCLEGNSKYAIQAKNKVHSKRISACRSMDVLSSSIGCLVRDSILEVLEEDDETDMDKVEGAVGGEVKGSFTGHLIPLGATAESRRASIVTADSRRASLLPQQEPIRVAVFGKDGVGKSALIVRLVTGRFIGEYDPSMEAIYNYQIPFPGHELPLQVMDTAGTVDVSEEGRESQVSWGEGFMLVFSLTSHSSLSALQHIRRVLVELTPGSPRPLILVGNKADLSHAREVTTKEILDLTDLWGCDYFEVSAAEPWDVVVRPFLAIYQAVLEARRC